MPPLEDSAVRASQALGVTLTGDKAKDDDIIQQGLSTASAAQKAAFYTVRYGSAWTNTFGGGDPFAPITRVITGGTGATAQTVDLDDPSIAWASDYWSGVNAQKARDKSEFDEIMSTVFSGRPTAGDSSSTSGSSFRFSNGSSTLDRSPSRPGGSSAVVAGSDDDDFTGRDPVTGFRDLKPRDRTIEDYGASIPPTRRVGVDIAVPDIVTGDDGGNGDSGGGGGGNGNGDGTDNGDDGDVRDSTVDRLFDLVSAQFAGAGGGGGISALPTVIAEPSDSGSSPVLIVVLLIGGGLLAWWLYKKYKRS